MKNFLFFMFLIFPLFCMGEKNNTLLLEERLNQLSPRSNVVVLQRRYLPRTSRFEISPVMALFLSSEFFLNAGLGGNLGINILEKHGFELRGLYAFSMQRQILLDLRDELSFRPLKSQDRTQGFMGLVYKWFPLYGKMTWWDRKIIPFETFLSLGGGVSSVLCSEASETVQTDSFFGNCSVISSNQDLSQKWEPTAVLGIGQSYSISRNSAIRVDFNYQLYPSRFSENGVSRMSGFHSDIVLSFAWSVFFPERGLR